jgi:outer membrane biosynthesis protein TonB
MIKHDYFFDKEIKMALFFSLSFHLACIFLFKIYIAPSAPGRSLDEIAFLGSILEKASFAQASVLPQPTARFANIELTAKTQESAPLPERRETSLYEKSKAELLPNPPEPVSKLTAEKKADASFAQEVFTLKGQITSRPLIYYPPLPKFENLAEKSLIFEFEVSVLPNGEVGEVKKLISSGDSEKDDKIANYLRQWRFGACEEQVNQSGSIKFNFAGE